MENCSVVYCEVVGVCPVFCIWYTAELRLTHPHPHTHIYTGCFTTLGHICRRWFPRSLWSKKFIQICIRFWTVTVTQMACSAVVLWMNVGRNVNGPAINACVISLPYFVRRDACYWASSWQEESGRACHVTRTDAAACYVDTGSPSRYVSQRSYHIANCLSHRYGKRRQSCPCAQLIKLCAMKAYGGVEVKLRYSLPRQ
jgi:hypothetical protein